MTDMLLMLSVLLGGVGFYIAFVARDWNPVKRLARSTFYAFLIASIVLGYIVLREGRAAAEISTYIDPYPSVSAVIWVPQLPGDRTRGWIFITSDSPDAVIRYYQAAAHRPGWTFEVERGGHLFLRKAGACLHIALSLEATAYSSHGTSIVYSLQEDCR